MGKKSNRSQGKNTIRNFEEMLKTGNHDFLDIATYDFIINYFLDEGKINKAQKACQ